MKMIQSRISNVPFLDGANDMYITTNKSNFKLADNIAMQKRDIIRQPVSEHLQREDHNDLGMYQTETALSFPSHSPVHVIQQVLTHLTMQSTNIKMHSGNSCGDFETTQSDFKTLPMSAAQLIRPTTAVRIALPGSKCPESTYRSSYTEHEVSPVLRAQETLNTGVGSSLNEDKRDQFSSSYRKQFKYRWCPTPSPSESSKKQRIQYSSVAMGDREKILNKQTTYSTSFSESGAHSFAKFREYLLPKINKSRPFNLRELADEKWITTSSEEFRAHKCGPIHLERRSPTLSFVFKGEMLKGNQERLSTTNQSFFPKIDRAQFPVHVNGASIRTLSNVKFGWPDLAGRFYSTTSQEQFPSKEVVRPKPPIYPPSYVLLEQAPDRMLTTVQKDFVPLNSRRQELSPSQLQQVKDSHIRPQHSKHDFRTTHNEAFVPKPCCKASLDNPPLQHISHMPF
ncbi:uncharacterized protein si:dkey-13m1.5 isoform X2 [Ctenopharyngodon idella]|uniref:uncharacterized protein si:dkey-13m1.5 isoform X2 n=1 Tax=Ctenopharyngodon idella TaxID=7959 RepID=UPI002231BFA6|nr:uncharacterized protein si:dkey-13m1.5 isoform X2 [Ctenopharyngodon idella]